MTATRPFAKDGNAGCTAHKDHLFGLRRHFRSVINSLLQSENSFSISSVVAGTTQAFSSGRYGLVKVLEGSVMNAATLIFREAN